MSDEKFMVSTAIDSTPLEKQSIDVVNELLNAQDIDKVKDLTNLFNINAAKKNAIRILKLEQLFDKVSDSMIDRFENRPGEFSNDDLLNYLNTVQNAIEKSKKNLNLVEDAQPIHIQQNNQVNISVTDTLSRDERENVKNAVDAILKIMQNDANVITVDEFTEEIVDDNSTEVC